MRSYFASHIEKLLYISTASVTGLLIILTGCTAVFSSSYGDQIVGLETSRRALLQEQVSLLQQRSVAQSLGTAQAQAASMGFVTRTNVSVLESMHDVASR
jgi:hypothetical protein